MLLAGNIVATKQMAEGRELLSPGEFFEHAAEVHHMYRACLAGQWRMMRSQEGKPTNNVWGPAQLVQRTDRLMFGPEIAQKVADCSAIAPCGVIAHRTRHGFHGGAKALRKRVGRVRS